jgi:hypothetical protein
VKLCNAAAGDECHQRSGDSAVDPLARLPHQPLDLKPLRHRLVGDGIVACVQRVGHGAP